MTTEFENVSKLMEKIFVKCFVPFTCIFFLAFLQVASKLVLERCCEGMELQIIISGKYHTVYIPWKMLHF